MVNYNLVPGQRQTADTPLSTRFSALRAASVTAHFAQGAPKGAAKLAFFPESQHPPPNFSQKNIGL